MLILTPYVVNNIQFTYLRKQSCHSIILFLTNLNCLAPVKYNMDYHESHVATCMNITETGKT